MRQKRTVSNNFKLGQCAAAPRHRAAQGQKLRAAGNKPVRHGGDDTNASTRKKLPLRPTICASKSTLSRTGGLGEISGREYFRHERFYCGGCPIYCRALLLRRKETGVAGLSHFDKQLDEVLRHAGLH